MSLHLVTGKGGVGKTRVSSILSQIYPSAELFDCGRELSTEIEKLGFNKRKVFQRKDSDLIYSCIKPVLRMESLVRWASENKLVEHLFQLGPNLLEFILLHQWVKTAKQKDLIIDAPSTGNFLGLIKSVQSARKMFDAGGVKDMATEIEKFFNNPGSVFVYIVSLPEISSLHEMSEIESEFKKIYSQPKIIKILNRKHLPPPVLAEEIPKEFHFLAFDRPQLEDERLKNYKFEHQVLEGEKSFA